MGAAGDHPVYRQRLQEVRLFTGADPVPKMRSFRAIVQRAAPDRRELGLLEATAFEVIHYERRLRERAIKKNFS